MIRALFLVLALQFTIPPTAYCQVTDSPDRISFVLKNTLGYRRMFRVEGPGIAYGFTMGRREKVPCAWPVGSRLYFSQRGEDASGLILTVSAADEGATLTTSIDPLADPAEEVVAFRLRNPGLLPRRFALISYVPGDRGNGTQIFRLFPLMSRSVKFPPGTKLYLADEDQVTTVMSGRRIDDDAPFLVVKEALAGSAVDLR